jgi:hypothetical protein
MGDGYLCFALSHPSHFVVHSFQRGDIDLKVLLERTLKAHTALTQGKQRRESRRRKGGKKEGGKEEFIQDTHK